MKKFTVPFKASMGLPLRAQAGVSLVLVMIFLVILSGLAINAMQGSTFSARIAGNESDRTLAFQAAEAALRDAENDIYSRVLDDDGIYKYFEEASATAKLKLRTAKIERGNDFDDDCSNGRCVPNASAPPWETTSKWTNASPASKTAIVNGSVVYGFYTGAARLPVVSQQPRYLIEYFNQGGYAVYRVTAIGYGANSSTQAMLQTAVKAPL
jgi:type IV pilus assembly protein PilX